MKEYDVLYRAAFVDNRSDESMMAWRDFIWIHILPFVDLFGIFNNVSAISKKNYAVTIFWTPSLRNLVYEFNLGTLS